MKKAKYKELTTQVSREAQYAATQISKFTDGFSKLETIREAGVGRVFEETVYYFFDDTAEEKREVWYYTRGIGNMDAV